jgi:hypothetical protein
MCQSATTEAVTMTAVGAEDALAAPTELLAVTVTSSVLPTSLEPVV